MTDEQQPAPQAYSRTLARFERTARGEETGPMVALIVDSPWLPGYAGINTLDFYFEPAAWLDAYRKVHRDLPGVAFVPGAWVEFGMATEPSGWGAAIRWSADSPPAVRHLPGGLAAAVEADVPDPETDGLMPAVLRQYERMMPRLAAEGIAPRMAAARGPLTVASHLVGVTELLMATQLEPDRVAELLARTTEHCIRWLSAQLKRIDEPLGVLVLDDVVGMLSPDDAEKFALPHLRRIYESFPSLLRLYHNDTPNADVFGVLAELELNVFNLSHEIDLARARELLGPDVVLMGNVPPLDVLVRGTVEDVRAATERLLERTADVGPLFVSPGGGVSPGTPIENLQA
ncbi:MAG: uroporphyrinogen decarboxylase, partial [Planctomycetes bacterium]|nr:uroporphyrinogen decarboxylase [Planctomycetota bacterium]